MRQPIHWSARFSVGIPELDEQHRHLISLINRLHRATVISPLSEVVSDTLTQLTHYARDHFQLEEEMMAAVGFPGLAEHRREHEVFIERVAELGMEAWEHHREVPDQLVSFLNDWLANHILGVDMAYKPHLGGNGPSVEGTDHED